MHRIQREFDLVPEGTLECQTGISIVILRLSKETQPLSLWINSSTFSST